MSVVAKLGLLGQGGPTPCGKIQTASQLIVGPVLYMYKGIVTVTYIWMSLLCISKGMSC